MASLAEAYPQEQARVRELLTIYRSLGPAGMFGSTMIEQVLQRADQAAAEQDTIAMIRSFKEMRDCQ